MSVSRKKALEYAYSLIEVPRAHVRVTLRQTSDGVSVLHGRRVLTRVFLNRTGMNAAAAIAEAIGVPLPKLGESKSALVSSGLLYRVLALSQLDFRKPEALEVASRLVAEAADMQSGEREDV
jgi:hypothetical protein